MTTGATTSESGATICSQSELERAGRMVVTVDGVEIVVSWNDGNPGALSNECIHRQRKLSEGAFFNGRLVCPGHQWSFDAVTGFCRERERYQPAHRVDLRDGDVVVTVAASPNAS